MADKLVLELIIDDKGSAIIKKFAQDGKASMETVSSATSKTSEHIGTLKNNWALLSAGVASSIYIFSQIKNALQSLTQETFKQEEAEFKLAIAMRDSGEYTKKGFDQLRKYADTLQYIYGIEDENILLMQAKMKQFGLTTEEIKKATEATLMYAVATGISAVEAGERIARATKGQERAISELRGEIDLGSQAHLNLDIIIKKLTDRFGESTLAMQGWKGQWQLIKTFWGEVAEVIGKVFIKALQAGTVAMMIFVGGILGAISGLLSGLSYLAEKSESVPLLGEKIKGLSTPLTNAAKYMAGLRDTAFDVTDANLKALPVWDSVGNVMDKVGGSAKKLQGGLQLISKETENLIKKLSEDIIRTKGEIEGLLLTPEAGEYKKAEAQREIYIKEAKGNAQALLLIDKWYALEKEKISTKLLEEVMKKIYEDEIAFYKNQKEKQIGIDKDVNEALGKVYKESLEKWVTGWENARKVQGKTLEESLKESEEIIAKEEELYRKLFQKTGMYAKEYLFYREELLNIELEKLRAKKVDEIALEAYKNDAMKLMRIELNEKLLKSSNDFFKGMAVAHEKNLYDQKSFAQHGFEIWNSVFGPSGALKGTLTNFFEDVFKGKLQSAKDYFNSFKDAVIRAFANMVATMTAQWLAFQAVWAASKIAQYFGLGTGPGAFNTGGGVGGGGANIGSTIGQVATSQATNYGAQQLANYLGIGTSAATPAAVAAYESYIAASAGPGWTAATAVGETGAMVGTGGTIVAMPSATGAGIGLGAELGGEAVGGGMGASAGAGVAVGAAYGGFAALGALIAYSAYQSATAAAYAQNPFLSNPIVRSNLGALALETMAPAQYATYYQERRPELDPLIDIVRNNPWFDPQNLYNLYTRSTGLTPTRQSIYEQGREIDWFQRRPEYIETLERIRNWYNTNVHYLPGQAEGEMNWYVGPQRPSIEPVLGYAEGGIINEPIVGRGLITKRGYMFGEKGQERIVPIREGQGASININSPLISIEGNLIADRQTFNDFVKQIHERLIQLQNWGYR